MTKFDRNIPYNDLPLLPPEKRLDENVEILKKLVSASRALASFNSNMLRLPNPLMLVNTIALQEAKTSTEIENIFTTDDVLYKAISDSVKEKNADFATKEVLKYREALWTGFKLLKEKSNITKELIIGIFQQIKDTNSEIRPPQAQVVIRRGSSELKPGEIIYTPPRGEQLLEKLINNWVEYLNDDEKYPTDPLIKMCVSHYQFEAIHPFRDGNGRTGRILNLLYLSDKKLLSHPTLYLSKYIIENKDDYYFKLSAVTSRKDWIPWVLFMLEAIEKTALNTNSMIEDIVNQMESTLDYGKKNCKWYSKEVNELIFSQPYIKPKLLGNLLEKYSRTTITKYFGELEKLGILRPIREGKEVFYVNDDLTGILAR